MSTIDFNAELAKAGAHIEGGWGTVLHLVRRNPLGAIGALVPAIFLGVAVFLLHASMLRITSDSRTGRNTGRGRSANRR